MRSFRTIHGYSDITRLSAHVDRKTSSVDTSCTGEKEERIIGAAIRVFSRHGAKRMLLHEIGGQAGLAHQTLYNTCSNKDEVSRATIRLFTDRILATVADKDDDAASLAGKLDLVPGQMVVRPFEMPRASPEADDIIGGGTGSGRDEIAAANERHQGATGYVLTGSGTTGVIRIVCAER